MHSKYTHTNLIAKDWKKLANFYINLFECTPVPPERDLFGEAISKGTGIQGAHIRGMHLRLPGWGEQGPTLEIFAYSPDMNLPGTAINRPGFGHIAFQVDDVRQAQKLVLASGGQAIGEVVSVPVGSGVVTFCYVTDPEGNAIELQSWKH
ncbi:MAG: VOC family protein [Anaerolineae bacterium]|nr:VOC family protein [Anaerolineae bacterium]